VTGRWMSDDVGLPTHRVPQSGIVGAVRDFDFDNCFDGFTGKARIRDEHFALQLSSSAKYLVVYTPQTKDYYCVEPVTHLSNRRPAGERPGRAGAGQDLRGLDEDRGPGAVRAD
jgi:aldose 1-epimerase